MLRFATKSNSDVGGLGGAWSERKFGLVMPRAGSLQGKRMSGLGRRRIAAKTAKAIQSIEFASRFGVEQRLRFVCLNSAVACAGRERNDVRCESVATHMGGLPHVGGQRGQGLVDRVAEARAARVPFPMSAHQIQRFVLRWVIGGNVSRRAGRARSSRKLYIKKVVQCVERP